MPPESAPDAGPRGYLPPKAARRARKIVLREPMGLGWPIAAVVAMVVLVGVAVAFVLLRTGPPDPPFVAAGPVAAIPQGTAGTLVADGTDVLVVRAGGRFRVFAAPSPTPAYCEASRRLEAADGVWTLDGARVGGGATSLAPLPSAVHDGTVYVDPTNPGDPLPPSPGDEAPGCAAVAAP